MIAPTVSMKLVGRHYEAFRAFALRSGANTTTENIKRLIESLPEFKSLLNIHENADPSVKCNQDCIKLDSISQEESKNG